MKNRFYFSEQFSSRARMLWIMRANGGRGYKPRQIWYDRFVKLAGTRHHYLSHG